MTGGRRGDCSDRAGAIAVAPSIVKRAAAPIREAQTLLDDRQPASPSRGPAYAPGFEISSDDAFVADGVTEKATGALVSRERAMLHRVLDERQEQHRRHLE